MRVAVVHSFYSSRAPSGENESVLLQVQALRGAGHDVRLFARYTDDLLNQKFQGTQAAYRILVSKDKSLLSEIGFFSPDVIHVHNLFPNYGSAWLKQARFPVVVTLHNYRPMCARGTLYRDGQGCTLCPDGSSLNALKYACYRGSRLATIPLSITTRKPLAETLAGMRPAFFVAPSSRLAQTYERYGLPHERIRVIPNFREEEVFAVLPEEKTWVFIGRLVEEKGVGELVEHWPEDGHFLEIYGEGPLREKLAKFSKANVKVLDAIAPHQVPGVLAKSQGLIFPSGYMEAGPTMSYLAALAAGRPTLALRGNAVADDVEESGSGLVVDSLESLAQGLDEITKDSSFAVRAAERFSAEFSKKIWLARIEDLYEQAIAERLY